MFGQNVYQFRKRQGRLLAEAFPIQADLVMPFPDSGNYAAIGYAQAAGIPLEMGMIRNHYIGRTFIQPSQSMRDFGVKVKLNPVRQIRRRDPRLCGPGQPRLPPYRPFGTGHPYPATGAMLCLF